MKQHPFFSLILIVTIILINCSAQQRSYNPPSFSRQLSNSEADDNDQQRFNEDDDVEEFTQNIKGPHRHGHNNNRHTTERAPTRSTYRYGHHPPTRTPYTSNLVDGEPYVETGYGTIKGLIVKTPSNKDVIAFYGVPFAKPPVGNLRFQRPQSYGRWNGVLDGTVLPNACYQFSSDFFPGFIGEQMWNPNTNVSEDCLYLNIWVPKNVLKKKDTELVDVLFWIFGGGFYSGSSSLDIYNGALLAAEQNIIVVSSNYRVGPLGFLYLGDNNVPGNQGLLDQNMALQWINEQIEHFGGDRNSITLMGESAGGASVAYHLVSPLSKSLFKRAILLSGVNTASWAFKPPKQALDIAHKLAKDSGCDTSRTPGGSSVREKQADGEIQELVDKLTPQIYRNISEMLDGKVMNSDSEQLFEALTYKTQMVAGKNYFIKIKNHGDDESIWHIRIHKPLRGEPSLSAVKGPENEHQPVHYFEFGDAPGSGGNTRMVECLRRVDLATLVRNQWKYSETILDFAMTPTIDGYFLKSSPEELINTGKRCDIIISSVKDEGSYFLLYYYLKYFDHQEPTHVALDRFNEIMNEIFKDRSEIEKEAIINRYTNWINTEDGFKNQKILSDAIGDAFLTCPIKDFANKWANRGLKVYYFHFTHRASTNPWGEWLGAVHGGELEFIFGRPLNDSSFSYGEKILSQKLMRFVGNFAKTGAPNTQWERYTQDRPIYLDLNATKFTESTPTQNVFGPKASECAFWNDFLPKLGTYHQDFYNENDVTPTISTSSYRPRGTPSSGSNNSKTRNPLTSGQAGQQCSSNGGNNECCCCNCNCTPDL